MSEKKGMEKKENVSLTSPKPDGNDRNSSQDGRCICASVNLCPFILLQMQTITWLFITLSMLD